ncbi:hypothetical protein F5B22DRAFT_638797 [Xylaria bambusicola]|uniref:uncharacterized protein n=1 Tax=Xylaria bambusicola TaxID=326684 RepID=UPI0020084E85|nr:uncharacterized protein F5B22DRAFT_638797 [Xylaria bambusicola]KAI0508249.1 hypothetical protein F5B22DRAFT_638797 [Xylaria bambusicola]
MVVCQACYEDLILSCPEFGIDHFEPSTLPHQADQTWFCDIAVPYIQREFKLRAQTNDWPAFVQGVAARMTIKPCPGSKTVYPSDNFYTPVRGPEGLLICKMCFCDYILLTNLSNDWKDAGEDLARRFGVDVGCYFGQQFNMQVLGGRTLDSNDRELFWKAMHIVNCSPRCQSQMQSPAWYTLLSNPPGFEICQGCMAAIVLPMGIEHHFTAKEGVSPESKITCSFNPGIARFSTYMTKLLELVYKQDPAPLESFVREYACLPMCARDRYVEKRHWYGWQQCTMCAECYHEFIRGTALADAMPSQGTYVEGGVMCEMYSERMRQLYLTACASNPADPTPLLEYSLQRRAVYAETMPRVRQIMSNMQIKVLQQRMALNNSFFYNSTGNTFYRTLPLETTYAGSAIGAGHHNHMHIKGAEYAAQAAAIGAEISGSPTYIADELERRWRAVE